MRPRIGISGVGLLTAFGSGVNEFRRGIMGRRLPFKQLEFPGLLCDCYFGGYICDPPFGSILGKKGTRGMSRESKLLSTAAIMASEAASIPLTALNSDGCGVVIGTVFSGLGEFTNFYAEGLEHGFHRVNPARGPLTSYNAPASQLSLRFGARAANVTVSAGTNSSSEALAIACRYLAENRMERALAGGIEVLSATLVLACAYTNSPSRSIKPFDRFRDGTILGEAAAVFILESLETANSRPIQAEILATSNAFASSSSPLALQQSATGAIRRALTLADRATDEIDAVFGSAGGDPIIDAVEAAVIDEVFSEKPTYAVKGAVGECLGASVSLQVAAALLWLRYGVMPATMGYSEADPASARVLVSKVPTAIPGRTALIVGIDRHGHTSAIVIEKPSISPMRHSGGDDAD